MQHWRYTNMYKLIWIVLGGISSISYAVEAPLSPADNSPENINVITEGNKSLNKEPLDRELPSEASSRQMSKEQSKAYLLQHPAEFETLLSRLLMQGNASSLKELLPIYKQVPNYDPSVIDWGNAIILASSGQLDEAVNEFRKINSRLPNVNVIRFQLAMALFYNRQFEAAENEFEKLRSDTKSEADIQVINKYLDAINAQNKWNFNASVSYLHDENINNSPKEGTVLKGENGSQVTYTAPRESGKGINYRISADKEWHQDNKFFTALHLNSYGKYYWDNKDYNDVTAGVGAGVGYKNATTEVELVPFFNKRWYAQGQSGDGDLHDYADIKGVRVNLSQWFSPKVRYQGLIRYSDTDYIDKYKYNDGDDWLFSNTAIYFPNGQQYWMLGLDYMTKSAEDDSQAFDRPGLRLGWGQTWPKGYSTLVSAGYAERNYDDEDFFGIERENKEYTAGITAWNRGFSWLGLTPRLSWDYTKVTSNSPFEEYDKNDVSIELTKAF